LSPAEQRVAQVIIDYAATASGLTISDLADRARSSETTVIRFCRAMGFSGYSHLRLTLAGETCDIGLEAEVAVSAGAAAGSGGSGAVLATMPGVVAEVRVSAGDVVEAGQVVVVLESMKLFSSLKAEIAGIVADVSCQPGETVMAGKRLVLIEPQSEA